ncbi:hypothetical protein Tco_0002772 [Tanacetum coccineum]
MLGSLLGYDYTQDVTLGSTPSLLSKLNFHWNSSEVQPIVLMEYMLGVVRHQALVSPTSSLEKVEKKKGIRSSQLLSECKPVDTKDSGEKYNPLIWDRLPPTLMKVNKTRSIRFEVSNPDHNKGKTSFEVEPDIQAPIQSFQDFDILMEDSKITSRSLPPPSTKKIILSEEQPQHKDSSHLDSQHEEHQSPIPADYQHESSKSVKKKEKKNLQGFSEVLYAQITEDNWEKHEEVVASYVDKSDMATLKTDTADIKAIVTEIFYAFKGQAFFAPFRSVPKPKLAITGVPATVRRRNKHA